MPSDDIKSKFKGIFKKVKEIDNEEIVENSEVWGDINNGKF